MASAPTGVWSHWAQVGEPVEEELTGQTVTFTTGFDMEFIPTEKESFKMKTKRFVVHGFGCGNWSEIVESEKELKKLIKELSNDKSWTGEIVAYELKPKFHVKRSTSIKKV